ncbi:MAG: DUF885 domain-containing protein [Chloroherpetonaceae bacterium]|nr:DUF885 domain-containing protein [Chthonomonadaceae bacterium]MDW8207745.1 DUF885 domain-containing protein [Chloroherpetonaceae bacterium]
MEAVKTVVSTTQIPEPEGAEIRFQQLTADFLASECAARPATATAMGVHTYDDRLEDFNRFALRDDRDRVRAYLHAIDKISLADLAPVNRVDYRIARSYAQMALLQMEQLRWPERQPVRYLDGLLDSVFFLIAQAHTAPDTRAVALAGRLRQFPEALLAARQNLKSPSEVQIQRAIRMARAGCTYLEQAVPLFAASLRSGGLAQTLLRQSDVAHTALSEFACFLEQEFRERAGEDGTLGVELYDYYLRVGHFLDPDKEDHQALIRIASEQIAEMNAALRDATQTGRSSEVQALRAQLAAETASIARHALTHFPRAVQQAREWVLRQPVFPLPPRDPLAVMCTPAFARSRVLEGAYLPPAPFAPQAQGMCWLTLQSDPLAEKSVAMPSAALNLLALYLTYPGQHLQAAFAVQHPSRFRRYFARSPLATEGWAVYAGEVMTGTDQGVAQSMRLLHLYRRLCHACLMLVDVQVHTRQMTMEQACVFLQTETGVTSEVARALVENCVLEPTRAIAPIMGYRALLALQQDVQRRQGSRFDLRRFHEQVLACGGIPPALLREALFPVI